MNYETNDPFPEPPDPTIVYPLLINSSFLESIGKSNFTQSI